MEYNFSTLAADNLEKIESRFTKLSKSILKEYLLALSVINSESVNKNWETIELTISDIFHDSVHKSLINWTQSLKLIEELLGKYL